MSRKNTNARHAAGQLDLAPSNPAPSNPASRNPTRRTPSATARRTLVATAAAGTALFLTPTAAFAATGGPGGGHPGGPTPKPAGPVQTVTKVKMPKILTSTKTLTLSAHVSPTHRSAPRTIPAETGTVVFIVDGTAGTPVRIAANKASEKVKLVAGKHTVDAKYSGDAKHTASDSGLLTITVS